MNIEERMRCEVMRYGATVEGRIETLNWKTADVEFESKGKQHHVRLHLGDRTGNSHVTMLWINSAWVVKFNNGNAVFMKFNFDDPNVAWEIFAVISIDTAKDTWLNIFDLIKKEGVQ